MNLSQKISNFANEVRIEIFSQEKKTKNGDKKDMSKEITKNGALANRDVFVSEIRTIIEKARSAAVRSVDFCRVQMYSKCVHSADAIELVSV